MSFARMKMYTVRYFILSTLNLTASFYRSVCFYNCNMLLVAVDA